VAWPPPARCWSSTVASAPEVAPLVEALNGFSDEIVTVDSCKGTEDGPAYVWFTNHGSVDELIALVRRLAWALSTRLHSSPDVIVRLEWFAGAEQPSAQLLVHRQHLGQITEALHFATPRKTG
jgi:hypothetical protein